MTAGSIRLRSGESAIFGYGSLCVRESVERTLGHRYEGPFVPCSLAGWRRAWDVAMPNETIYADTAEGRLVPESILYLNIQPDAGSTVNGVLFLVSAGELEAFDRRESVYNRVRATGDLRGVTIEGGDAWVYVAKPEHVRRSVARPAEAAVCSTYLEIIEAALRYWGDEFRREWEHSSDPVPKHLVIQDRRKE
jgi:gamma-glutamyl AIG2-like cyclotransferase